MNDVVTYAIMGALIGYILHLVIGAAKVLAQVIYPINRRPHLVFLQSRVFSNAYGEPTFIPVSGHIFESSAKRHAEKLAKIGHNVFVHQNLGVYFHG